MASRPEPQADDAADRHKNELILRWLEDVQMASQQVPRIPDRGLISNPASTSYTAHSDPMALVATATHSNQTIPPHSLNPLSPSPAHLHHHHSNQTTNSQSKSYTVTAKRSNSFTHLTLSSSRRQPSQSNSETKTYSSTTHQRSPLVMETVTSCHSVCLGESPMIHEGDNKEQEHEDEEKSVELLLEKDKSGEESSADRQRLRETRSLARTRQSSLSPLPLPTMQPSLPTFNLSGVKSSPDRRDRLKKKLPTVSGVGQLRRPAVVKRSPQTQQVKQLLRASTSPSELTLMSSRSAPSSPKPSRASVDARERDALSKEEEEESGHSQVERRRRFSHDDLSQLEQLDDRRRNVGGVSPAASYDPSDGNAPSSQQSLVAEEGSSKDEGDSTDDSSGKMESFHSRSDEEVRARGSSEENPTDRSKSPARSSAECVESDDKPSLSRQLPGKKLDMLEEDQSRQEKMMSSAVCPISPPSVLSPRPPHSPLIRQRHVSRSPSPPHPHTPSSSSPYHHKSRHSSSNSGTESENVISKQKLRLLDEGLTFSFDTSEDKDIALTKVSKQPKFLRKTFTAVSSCPLSPPSLLSALPSPGGSSLSQYLSQRHHSQPSTANPPLLSSTTGQYSDPSSMAQHQHTAGPAGKILQSRSPVLSEQLSLRRGSTPVNLALSPTSPPLPKVGSASFNIAPTTRPSLHSVVPLRPVSSTSTQCDRRSTEIQRSTEKAREHSSSFLSTQKREESFRFHKEEGDIKPLQQIATDDASKPSGELDKGPVNRQDSGIGTLSTTSNKCDFRM